VIEDCRLAGANKIFRVGGAQAIAAMALGKLCVPAVKNHVGSGYAYVNKAKRQVFGPVGTDQLASPSRDFGRGRGGQQRRNYRHLPACPCRAQRAHVRGTDHNWSGTHRG
jgi:hypothetical protein